MDSKITPNDFFWHRCAQATTSLLLANHMIIPMLAWLGPLFLSIEETHPITTFRGVLLTILVTWLPVVAAYTVASTPTTGAFSTAIPIKLAVIALLVAITRLDAASNFGRQTGENMSPTILIIEATFLGAFESAVFDQVLSMPLADPSQYKSCAKQRLGYLCLILVGTALLPRLASRLGLPTHHSLELEKVGKTDWIDHILPLVFHLLIKEALIYVLPSTFARLSIADGTGGVMLFSKLPFPEDKVTGARITIWHTLMLFMVIHCGRALLKPVVSILIPTRIPFYSEFVRMSPSARRLELLIARMVRIAVTGHKGELVEFVRKGWAGSSYDDFIMVTDGLAYYSRILFICVILYYCSPLISAVCGNLSRRWIGRVGDRQ